MRAATLAPAARELAPKPSPTPTVNRLTFTVAELREFLRGDLGLSRRDADLIARRVESDAELARNVLPERWADDLHPAGRHARTLREVRTVGADGLFTAAEHERFQTATRHSRRAVALAYARQGVRA